MSIKLSKNISKIEASVTLKLNSKAVEMAASGRELYNLTAGQLTFRPPVEFTNFIRSELDFMKSFQYSPVAGDIKLREKIVNYLSKTRKIEFEKFDMSCAISNGAKHSISNTLAAILNSGDEVIVFSPYWVTYPEIIKYYNAKMVIVKANEYEVFIPSLDDLRNKISKKTKAIIINSPNNPTGVKYSKEWMQDFASMMDEFPNIFLISDEIYFELNFYDPKPLYFYNFNQKLLARTMIIDGISKSLASTGLRIGYCLGPKYIVEAMNRLQGHSTSGPNSLIQRALCHYDFDKIEEFLVPVKKHLRENITVLRDFYTEYNMSHLWYQPTGAFYFLLDFTPTNIMKNYNDDLDHSFEICDRILEEVGVAIVPGGAFGSKNTARISLVLEKDYFTRAIEKLIKFLWS